MGPTSEMPIITQNMCSGCVCAFTPLERAAGKHPPVDLDVCVNMYWQCGPNVWAHTENLSFGLKPGINFSKMLSFTPLKLSN